MFPTEEGVRGCSTGAGVEASVPSGAQNIVFLREESAGCRSGLGRREGGKLGPTGVGVNLPLSRARTASEMDDDAHGGASAIGGIAGVVQADIVHLRAQSQVRSESDIHAAADAKGKLVGG